MATLDKMIGKGREIAFGGEVYTLPPITLSTFADMQLWCEVRPLAEANEEILAAPDMPDSVKEDIFKVARKRVRQLRRVREGLESDDAKIENAQEYLEAKMNSIEGSVHLLWTLLKGQGVSKETVRSMINEIGVVEIQELLDLVNGVQETATDVLSGSVEKKTGLTPIGQGYFAVYRNRLAGLLKRSAAFLWRK